MRGRIWVLLPPIPGNGYGPEEKIGVCLHWEISSQCVVFKEALLMAVTMCKWQNKAGGVGGSMFEYSGIAYKKEPMNSSWF